MANSQNKSEAGGAAVGAGIAGYYSQGNPQAMAGGASIGASIGSMFGGSQYRRRNRYMRKDYEYAARYQPMVAAANFDGQMASFEKHGIHPLFGLGGSTGGGSPAFSMPGQSEQGSHMTQGLSNILDFLIRKEELDVQKSWLDRQARDSAMRVIDNKMGNDNKIKLAQEMGGVTIPKHNPKTTEVDKGKVQPHNTRHPEQNTSQLSPMTKFKIGSQEIWFAVQETDAIMEDPVAAIGSAMLYHGNKGVDWLQVINELTGKKPTPKQVTQGTKKMLKRLGLKTPTKQPRDPRKSFKSNGKSSSNTRPFARGRF